MAYIIVQEEITGTMARPFRQWVARLISENLDLEIMLGFSPIKKEITIFATKLGRELDILIY